MLGICILSRRNQAESQYLRSLQAPAVRTPRSRISTNIPFASLQASITELMTGITRRTGVIASPPPTTLWSA
jgi:hypothetical protein